MHSATPGPVRPDGQCVLHLNYPRKIYNDHILAVNTTSASYGGLLLLTCTFRNGNMYCTDMKTNHFYLYFMSPNSESFHLRFFYQNQTNITNVFLEKFI